MNYDKKKIDKIFEELWDANLISNLQLKRINELLNSTKIIDFNKRWNILK